MIQGLENLKGIYTYNSSRPFIEGIAETLLNFCRSDPLLLSSFILIVPTARVKRALLHSFISLQKKKGTNALFLPTFFTFGEIPDRPTDFLSVLYQDVTYKKTFFNSIPLSLSSEELLLMCWDTIQKVTPLFSGQNTSSSSLEEELSLAQNICDFLDHVYSEGKTLEEITLSLHGKSTLYEEKCLLFLDVFKKIWPYFNETKAIPSALYKQCIFSKLSQILTERKTNQPVFVLGPQGLFPGSKIFLKSILALSQGVIVLDPVTSFSFREHKRNPVPFPNFWLYEQKHLLKFLDIDFTTLAPWPLITDNLQPSSPSPLSFFIKGLQGCSALVPSVPLPSSSSVLLFEGETLFDEARYIALKMREVLNHPTKTAALVTPSRALAQAVQEELKRWDIFADSSLGISLSQTQVGRLLFLLSSFCKNPICPFNLLSLLTHPYAFFSSQKYFHQSIHFLEKYGLRGLPLSSFADIKNRVMAHASLSHQEQSEILSFLENCEKVLSPLLSLQKKLPFSTVLKVLLSSFKEIISSVELVQDTNDFLSDDIKEVVLFLEKLLTLDSLSPLVSLPQIPFLLKTLLDNQFYYVEQYNHPRLSIWGCTEIRLLEKDVFILGGLNAGYWPKASLSNPWISKEFMEEIKIDLTQKDKGEMAHDFAQGLRASEIILTYHKKESGNLLDPSCFLLYLKQSFEAAGMPLSLDEKGKDLVQKIAETSPFLPLPACPSPTPPLATRPRQLSISDISLLRKDPYSFYAKKILNLLPLDSFLSIPGPQEFGNLLHQYLEIYVKNTPSDPETFFLKRLEQEPMFQALSPFKQESWKSRLKNIFAFFESKQKNHLQEDIQKILCEYKQTFSFDLISSSHKPITFTLHGRLDRLEITKSSYNIIDYKTGSLPSYQAIKEGYEPQLPLLGFLIQQSPDYSNTTPIELFYWHLNISPSILPFPYSSSLIQEAEKGMHRLLLTYYLNPSIGFCATSYSQSPYTHLKRTKEWAGPLSFFHHEES